MVLLFMLDPDAFAGRASDVVDEAPDNKVSYDR